MVSIGLLLPTVSARSPLTASALEEVALAAEELGFDSIWVLERLFHRVPVLDAWTVLTWVAARTHRIRLGTSVLLALLRNPAVLAKEVATLDALSGGRLELGVSLGGTDAELAVAGVRRQERATRFEETLTILRALLEGEAVTFSGRYYRLDNATIAPRPTDHIPLWIGAVSEPGMERAARLSDGWLSDGFLTGVCRTPEDFRGLRQTMLKMLTDCGRSERGFRFGKLFYWVDVSSDIERSREKVDTMVSAYYGKSVDPQTYLVGPPEVIIARLRGFVEAGLDTIVLGPATADAEQVRILAEQVLPELRRAAPA